MEAWPVRDPDSRRVKRFDVSLWALTGLLTLDGTFSLKMEGFPEGAIIQAADVDNERYMLRLFVEHESFPETVEGCTVPVASAIVVTRTDPASHIEDAL